LFINKNIVSLWTTNKKLNKMKKLLTLILLSLIGFGTYSQTHTPFSIKIRIKNTAHCSIQLRGVYFTSSSTTPSSFGAGTPAYFIPSGYFTGDSAVAILPYDTTTTFNFAVITSGCPCNSANGGVNINAYHTKVVYANFCDSFPMGIEIIPTTPKKKVVKIIDEMGRESQPEPNKLLIYIYSDGTIERKINLK
jgi:hypothetical protein